MPTETTKAAETTTRSDVEWTPVAEGAAPGKPCDCGHCLICEVEALAGE